jgi:hypothetical protein
MHFEQMMDKLEKGSGNTVLSERDAQILLKDEEDLVIAIYDYWLAKRLRLGHSLIPTVRNERKDGSSSSNPYLAFRKRTEKMQTRKNRKNDEQAYTHMLKLKRDLMKSLKLMELTRDREIKKNELDHCYASIFRKRYQLEDWSGSLVSNLRPMSAGNMSGGRRLSAVDGQWEGKFSLKVDSLDDNRLIISKKRKKKKIFSPMVIDNESPLTPPTLAEKTQKDSLKELEERNEANELDGPYSFKRKVHIHYHRNLDWSTLYGPSSDYDPTDCSIPKRFKFSLASLNGRKPCYFRRRQGRGGRVVWDRTWNPNDSFCDDTSQNIVNGESDKQDNDNSLNTEDTKCNCYHPVSPAPNATNFDFSYLPFIDPATYYCPDLSKGYSKFGGMQSDTESQDGVSSFSTLPTSQFALKPSTQTIDNNSSPTIEDNPIKQPPASVEPLPIPPTQLSQVEVGLPVQIHVGNLKHLPRQDSQTASVSNDVQPLSLPPPSSGATPKATDTTSNIQQSAGRPTSMEDSKLNWQMLDPSSNVLLLDKPLKNSKMFSRFKGISGVTPQIISNIINQFKVPVKPEPPSTSTAILTPPLSAPPIIARTPSLPISSLPPLPLQNKLVTLDQTIVREKNATPVHINNNQKNSPNGGIHEVFHHSKLQTEAEKDIKQALGVGAVVNRNSLVDGSPGTNAALVKLNAPPSHVT